jgi:putative ABC transport system permease protein
MGRMTLFYRLIVRPLLREHLRTLLTITAVALGVAVVVAIELAGDASAGSFRSSIETLAGNSDFEVTAVGGVPGEVVGKLATLPYPLQVTPRIAAFTTIVKTGQTVPLFGIDMVAESSAGKPAREPAISFSSRSRSGDDLDGVWVSSDLGYRPGGRIRLQINDHVRDYPVLGAFDATRDGGHVILMDLALADRELGRHGRVDQVLLELPPGSSPDEWQKRLASFLPPGVKVRPVGSRTAENRRMLSAFRWNLRVLSYIALLVGAFLIYNQISVSVVRRRPEIGIIRALGASRRTILAAFLGEAACLGFGGGLAGCLLGLEMAKGSLGLIASTVNSLYVSSRPAPIELAPYDWFLALAIGIGMSLVAAWAPAREAASVAPVEAMARGQREYLARVNQQRDLWIAFVLGIAGALMCFAPAVGSKPLFGYFAALLMVGASAFAMPAMVDRLTAITARLLRKLLGVEGLLASRSLRASLRRTSVLAGALATAIAMITSVGIMVGSFRQTVQVWMENQLQADFYLRPAGADAADQHPTLSPEIADRIENLPGVAAVDRFRAYDISYQGLPATLGSADLRASGFIRKSVFLSHRPASEVYKELIGSNAAIVSEPFANKHHVRAGDSLTLDLGGARVSFRVVDVYYDYGSEAGFVIVDRQQILKYLPDPAPSDLAVYAAPGADLSALRGEIEKAVAGRSVLVSTNRTLRAEGMQVFDRTFRITYALEAVSILVAVIGIAGALLALVVDRRREFGLMRFLGANGSQIRKVILVEAGLIGLLANVAGILLGFALSLVLIYVINKQSFGWTIQFHWPVAVLLGALTLVYLVTLLAGLYPARVALRLNPIEVVHEE